MFCSRGSSLRRPRRPCRAHRRRCSGPRAFWRCCSERPVRISRVQSRELPESLPVPRLPAGMGTPGDLLDARPDLRIAAAGLNAADRRKVSAWMGLLPTVALSGSTGDAGQKIGADSDWQTAGTWSVGVERKHSPVLGGGVRWQPLVELLRRLVQRSTTSRAWP